MADVFEFSSAHAGGRAQFESDVRQAMEEYGHPPGCIDYVLSRTMQDWDAAASWNLSLSFEATISDEQLEALQAQLQRQFGDLRDRYIMEKGNLYIELWYAQQQA